MLTARVTTWIASSVLELGADDYVPKPCTPRELVARIRAILRRARLEESSSSSLGSLTAGPLTIWPENVASKWDGVPLDLTSTEFNLLEVLVRNAGRVVSKKRIIGAGFGPSAGALRSQHRRASE